MEAVTADALSLRARFTKGDPTLLVEFDEVPDLGAVFLAVAVIHDVERGAKGPDPDGEAFRPVIVGDPLSRTTRQIRLELQYNYD